MKYAVSLCFCALLAQAGRADVISWNPTAGEDGQYTVAPFDTGLGTLTSASLNLTAQGILSLTVSNSSATAGGFNGMFAPSLMILGYPLFHIVRSDQIMLSGYVQPFGTYTVERNIGFYRNGLALDGIGADPWSFSLMPNSGVQGAWVDHPGLGVAGARMDLVSAELSGEYEYTPAASRAAPAMTHTPEPGYFVLLGAGLAAMALAARRRMRA